MDDQTFDSLIANHIEKMWGGLEMASVQHFMETGSVNGSFRLRLIDMLSQIILDYEREEPKAAAPKADVKSKEEILKKHLEDGKYPFFKYASIYSAMEEYANQFKSPQ